MRVIAGEFGGRRLHAPRGLGTRPTTDRVREALIMSLEPLAGLTVLDLFAGSGALGIEALSRGAKEAHFVEGERRALAALASNLEAFDLGARSRVWPLALPGALARLGEVLARADIVFMDPPYGSAEGPAVLSILGDDPRLRDSVRVVLEHHAKDAVPERAGALVRVRERRYGETMVSMFRKGAQAARPVHEEEQA